MQTETKEEILERRKENEKKFWAGGFLYNPRKKAVLLHKRDLKTKINPGKWAFFGGLGESGENPRQAFRRELLEELSIDISDDQVIYLTDYCNEELKTYRYVFFVESGLEKEQMKLGEGEGFEWVSLEKITGYDLTEKTVRDLKNFSQKIIKMI